MVHRPGWSRTSTGRAGTCSPSSSSRPRRPHATGGWWWRPPGRASSPRRRRGAQAARGRPGAASAADCASLVHALVGDALPEELVDAVVERSDGTPLFIEELLRTWVGVGTLVREGDAWRLTARPDAVPLPRTVQAIYAAQLDDLPSDARLVARRGAVAGRRLPVGALHALDLADAGDGLEALRRRAFFTGPLEDPVTGEAYAYRHALLRDAGYASLARAERARLHLAMAAWLIETAGDRADVVAEAIAEHHASALELDAITPVARPAGSGPLAAMAAGWYERAAQSCPGPGRGGCRRPALSAVDRAVCADCSRSTSPGGGCSSGRSSPAAPSSTSASMRSRPRGRRSRPTPGRSRRTRERPTRSARRTCSRFASPRPRR